MALKSSKKIENNLYEIEFDVDKATFDAATEKAYRKQVKNINIAGFRKGKAPRSVIERMYGKGVFYEDAINDVIPDAYENAIKDFELTVVSKPEFDVVSIDDNGVVLKAKFYTKPEVSIKDYKGIEVKKEEVSVSDDEVDEEVEQARKRNGRIIDAEEGHEVVNGDIAVIDYEGFCDGVAFEGGKGENYNLNIGSGTFIPGFEDQIIGHKAGESFDVNVTFPEKYHSDDLAGKDATFKVVLHSVKFNELPALDDEFAKDVSEFDTLDEYKADVKAKIQKRKETNVEKEVEGQIIDKLIENLEADIPAAMFDAEVENNVRDYDYNLRMQGMDLNTYFKYTGLTLDTLRTQLRPMAERQVKARLALEKIAELENIEVSDEDINAEYENIAKMYGMEVEKTKELVGADGIKLDLQVKKAVDLVKASAVNAK